jgi:hypothetical protein
MCDRLLDEGKRDVILGCSLSLPKETPNNLAKFRVYEVAAGI